MAFSTRLFFMLLMMLLMLAATAALSYQPAGAATDEVAATPELSAMILTPFDLGLAGMADYPIAGVSGELHTPAELVADAVTLFGATPTAARRAFVDSGLQDAYRADDQLEYPIDSNSVGDATRTVTTTWLLFPDEEAATADFDPIAAVGDQSRAMTAPAPDQPYPDITLTFRIGAVIANVTMHGDVGQTDAATVLMLAGRLQQRIAAVLADTTAGLSELVLHRMGRVG
jgi:hypothetical protein